MPIPIIRFLRREGSTLLLAGSALLLSVLLIRSAIPSVSSALTCHTQTRAFERELSSADTCALALQSLVLEVKQLEQRCLGSAEKRPLVSDAASACDLLVRLADDAGIRFVRLMPEPGSEGRISLEFSEPFGRLVLFVQSLERVSSALSIEDCVMQLDKNGRVSVHLGIAYLSGGGAEHAAR